MSNGLSIRKVTINKYQPPAFTLAEVLITLAVIGIVAALTIPGLIKNHNEKAWTTAQNVFSKKLEVAMKVMNTDGTLTGYTSTENFVNALKKNIKITRICTGNEITKCFADKVIWSSDSEPVNITAESVQYESNDNQDWAETIGVQFANGVNALLAYNKNCTSEPFNNQFVANAKCIGIIYDINGFKSPNQYSSINTVKDITANANVKSVNNQIACIYDFGDGKCITKLLAPDTGYAPFSSNDCRLTAYKYGTEADNCSGTDYWSAAVSICEGPQNMPTTEQLLKIAQDIYNTDSIINSTGKETKNLSWNSDLITPFTSIHTHNSSFYIWMNREVDSTYALNRRYSSDSTAMGYSMRSSSFNLAACVGDKNK